MIFFSSHINSFLFYLWLFPTYFHFAWLPILITFFIIFASFIGDFANFSLSNNMEFITWLTNLLGKREILLVLHQLFVCLLPLDHPTFVWNYNFFLTQVESYPQKYNKIINLRIFIISCISQLPHFFYSKNQHRLYANQTEKGRVHILYARFLFNYP